MCVLLPTESQDDAVCFAVTRCQPEVDHISALLLQLNSSNNFAAFVQALRAAFQSMS